MEHQQTLKVKCSAEQQCHKCHKFWCCGRGAQVNATPLTSINLNKCGREKWDPVMAIMVHFRFFLDMLPLDDHESATIVPVCSCERNPCSRAGNASIRTDSEQKQPKFWCGSILKKTFFFPNQKSAAEQHLNGGTCVCWIHTKLAQKERQGSSQGSRCEYDHQPRPDSNTHFVLHGYPN